MSDTHRGRQTSVAFLLAQVGALAAREFSKSLEPLKFTPPDAGILRLLSRSPGISQQDLAKRLDMHASRLVAIIDALQNRGFVAREPNPADRRVYALQLTAKGRNALAAIGAAAQAHNERMCEGLDTGEREQLAALLGKVSAAQGLTPDVHPGYRDVGNAGPGNPCETQLPKSEV